MTILAIPKTKPPKIMSEELVTEIHFTSPKNGLKKYSVDEFILIDPATKVMMTIGENNFEYFNSKKEEVSIGKALLYLAKKRRKYLDSKGIKY